MYELRARFFVRTSDEFAERAVDCDEDAVVFVERETLHEGAIGPVCEAFSDFGDYRIKGFRAAFTNRVQDMRLQIGRVKLAVVVLRQTLSGREYLSCDGRINPHICVIGKAHSSAAFLH